MPFVRAGPAEISRAAQKDDAVIRHLQSLIADVEVNPLLRRFLIPALYKNSAWKCLGQFLYYLMTTLSGLQTLGEEYTGILQVDSSLQRLPSKLNLWRMVVLECLGPELLRWFQTLTTRIVNNGAIDSIDGTTKIVFVKSSQMLQLISLLHKTLFYYNCSSYHLSKRISGIHYVLVRFWLKDRQSISVFKLLGLVSSLQFLTLLLEQQSSSKLQFKRKEHKQSSPKPGTCVICADEITSPAATPCGHVFCWYCIIEWTRNEQNCPVCRRTVAPNRLVPIMNRIDSFN